MIDLVEGNIPERKNFHITRRTGFSNRKFSIPLSWIIPREDKGEPCKKKKKKKKTRGKIRSTRQKVRNYGCYWNSRVHGDSSVACGFVFLADRIKTGVICVSSGEKKKKREEEEKKRHFVIAVEKKGGREEDTVSRVMYYLSVCFLRA